MRCYLCCMMLVITSVTWAQSSDKNSPDQPPGTDLSEVLGQQQAPGPEANQVNVIIKKDQIIEEYRHKGELVMVKVIPTDGVPYYIDPQARHKRTGAHSDLINSGVEPVHWVIKRF